MRGRDRTIGWEFVAPDGSVAVGGTDIVTVDADGRIAAGFFGDLAPADCRGPK